MQVIVADDDRMIAPQLQRDYARKLNATTTKLKRSHVPMLPQSKKVADVTLAAVQH